MEIGQYTVGENTGPVTRPGYNLGAGNYWDLYIEQYGGVVDGTNMKDSFMRGMFNIRPVRGTDTISNNRVGKSHLQAVAVNVRPTPTVNQFGKVSVTVDTVILARANVAELDDYQVHFAARQEIGMEHGKEHARFTDEAFIIQGIKAAYADISETGGTAPEGWTSTAVTVLGAAGDELDPDKLQRGIEDTCQKIEEQDIDLDGFVMLVRPAQYYALLRNDKLISSEYSLGNGNRAMGNVLRSNGIPIVKTNRLPTPGVFPGDLAGTDSHLLSNARNANAYDITEAESHTVALLLHSKALLAGETIPMTTKVYFSDIEMQWFIDAYQAFGVTPNRGDYVGAVQAAYTPEA